MLRYIVRRLCLGLFTVWAISVLTFLIMQLPPGDFLSAHIASMGDSGNAASSETIARL